MHPRLATIPCSFCQKYVVNIPDGKIMKHEVADGVEEPTPRPPGAEPPCGKCPKQSPEYEFLTMLNGHNEKLLLVRKRILAARKYGQSVELSPSLRRDPVLSENLGTIDELMAEFERESNAKAIALELLPFVVRR